MIFYAVYTLLLEVQGREVKHFDKRAEYQCLVPFPFL